MYKQAIRTTVLALVLTFAFGSVAVWASPLHIYIKETVTLNSATIRLGDIAKFSPLDDPRIGKLASIKIAASPPPGRSATIDGDFLIYRISSFINREKDVDVRIPQTLHVRRRARVLKQKKLREIFETYLREHATWDPEMISIERFTAPEAINLPMGKLRWSVTHHGKTGWVGPVSLTATFWVDGKPIIKVPMSATVAVKLRFLKAAKKIVRGQVIGPNDIVVVHKMANTLNRRYLRDPKDAVGKEVVRTVFRGQFLTKSMIRNVPLVKKGQQIRILAENDHVRVTTLGRALQDGQSGDKVKVINVTSGKEILATVKGPGIVVVKF